MTTRQNAPANRLVIGLAQIDCTVGDIAGNVARVRAARAEAAAFGADHRTEARLEFGPEIR